MSKTVYVPCLLSYVASNFYWDIDQCESVGNGIEDRYYDTREEAEKFAEIESSGDNCNPHWAIFEADLNLDDEDNPLLMNADPVTMFYEGVKFTSEYGTQADG